MALIAPGTTSSVLFDLVTAYREIDKMWRETFTAKFQLNERAGEFRIRYKYGPTKYSDAEIDAILESDQSYHKAVEDRNQSRDIHKQTDDLRTQTLIKLQDAPYDVFTENITFRGPHMATSYRGFTGIPCPSCKGINTFVDRKCQKDGTPQYISDIELASADENFEHGIYVASSNVELEYTDKNFGYDITIKDNLPALSLGTETSYSIFSRPILPLGVETGFRSFTSPSIPDIDPELYTSGYNQGYMGANVPCPNCQCLGSYRDGVCFACKALQYPPGTTTRDVQNVRDELRREKCYRSILDALCPLCGRKESFMYRRCFDCGFEQYGTITAKVRAKKILRKFINILRRL